MNILDGNKPTARNGPMRSIPYNAKGCFTPFGLPQNGPHQLSGKARNLPFTLSFNVLLQELKKLTGNCLGAKTLNVNLISNVWTLPKLKMISLFADMGTDRAQPRLQDTFYGSPESMRIVIIREMHDDFVL
jgi:hypothetical protein